MTADPLAEMLCRADDTMDHHDQTDDFPCWHCKANAVNLRILMAEHVAKPEVVEAVALAGHRGRVDAFYDPIAHAELHGARAALAALLETLGGESNE